MNSNKILIKTHEIFKDHGFIDQVRRGGFLFIDQNIDEMQIETIGIKKDPDLGPFILVSYLHIDNYKF